ncbi:MAG: histidinol-phosphatase HisJ family protein [Lachnospiraceae bacterium]|nr:histidinol-phosphatase HisJ family protein [Lachnospiraceae bacterium]
MFTDYHVHTDFSDDSFYLMESVIEDAIAMGMNEICFTDHVDYGIKRDWNSGAGISYRDGKLLANVDYPLYYESIRQFQYIYGSKIAIRMGLEFGIQSHTIPQYEKLFQRYPFDFIILSVHEVDNQEFWPQDFQRGKTQQEYNERYYQELLEVIKKYKNYSVLGHLDLITRYDKNGIYPFEKVRPIITEILKIVIKDGKGIEVNTSSHRYGLKDLTPSRDILKLYRELAGTILTIGSDSHEKGHLGSYIKETKKELCTLGFDTYCTFQRMEPYFHSLLND